MILKWPSTFVFEALIFIFLSPPIGKILKCLFNPTRSPLNLLLFFALLTYGGSALILRVQLMKLIFQEWQWFSIWMSMCVSTFVGECVSHKKHTQTTHKKQCSIKALIAA